MTEDSKALSSNVTSSACHKDEYYFNTPPSKMNAVKLDDLYSEN